MPAEEEQDDKGGKQPKDKEGKTPKEKEAGKQPKEKEKEGKQPKEQDGTPPKEKASKPKEKESKQPKEKDDKEPKKKESKPPKEKEPPASEEGEEDGEEDEASPPAPDACPADSAAEQSESNGRGRSRNLHELKETLESTADRALADAARVKEQAVKFKDSVVSDVTRHFEAVRSVLPASKSQALSALQNTDLRFLAKAPWLLGLFVPPPSWPPEPLTVKAPRLAATVLAFGVLCAMVAGSACAVGLMFVWLGAVIVPVLFLLAPVLLAGYLAAWVYYRHRPRLGPPPSMYEFRRANAEAAEKAEAKALEEIKNMERLMREDTRSEEAHSEFVAHVKEATSLAIYGCGEKGGGRGGLGGPELGAWGRKGLGRVWDEMDVRGGRDLGVGLLVVRRSGSLRRAPSRPSGFSRSVPAGPAPTCPPPVSCDVLLPTRSPSVSQTPTRFPQHAWAACAPENAAPPHRYLSSPSPISSGILAAAHVGGLFALERYGLQYDKLQTMAGVSAGAVIVACLSVRG
jgi:membrane protein implicated in regulation of membrane protease activity